MNAQHKVMDVPSPPLMEHLHMVDEDRYEVRRVPSNWVHPVDGIGKYILLSNYDDNLKENLIAKRMEDYQNNCKGYKYISKSILYEFGECLRIQKREEILKAMMPNWPEDQKTHFMMYKVINGSGFPISPIFEYAYSLAVWLEENYVLDDFSRASFLEWSQVIKVGSVPIFVHDYNAIRSGVKAAWDY